MGLSNPSRPGLRPVLRTAVVLGDSITAANATLVNGMWHFGNSFSEKGVWRAGMRALYNAGVPGEKSFQIVARLTSQVLAYNPDVCIIMSGTNDVTSGSFGTAANAAYMNYIEQMVTGCLNAGVLPVICVPPAKTGTPDAYKNRYFYYMLCEYYGIPLVDMCQATIDTNDTFGGWIANLTIDGTHPSSYGTDLMADLLVPALQNPYTHKFSRLPYFGVFPETVFGEMSNLLYNSNFLHLHSASPVNEPDAWSINQTNAFLSYEDAAFPYTGKTVVYRKTDQAQVLLLNSNNVDISDGGFVPGDTMFCSVRVALRNVGALDYNKGLNVQMQFSTGDYLQFESNSGMNEDVIFSGEAKVPAGTTWIQMSIATSQSGEYRVNNPTIINKTRWQALWQPGKQ
jgi:lysophospholipase L1-like esterase